MTSAQPRPERTQREPGWWVIGGYTVRQINPAQWSITDADDHQLNTAATLAAAERWITTSVPYFDGWQMVESHSEAPAPTADPDRQLAKGGLQ